MIIDATNDSSDSNADTSGNEYDQSDHLEYETGEQASKRKQWKTKNDEEYQRMFNENRYLFDLSCDHCSTTFQSLDEGRAHYSSEHSKIKGYIKCCRRKMYNRSQVIRHLQRHLNSETFK